MNKIRSGNMNINQRQGLISIIGSVGIIILVAGIFLENVKFTYALFLAISFWILAGVATKFLGVSRDGSIVLNAGWRLGVVSLIGSIGLIILLAGIFLEINFNYALVTAIVFWVISGIVATFLGIDNQQKHQRISFKKSDQYSKENLYSDSPAKQFCPACGASMTLDSMFCSNCGSTVPQNSSR